MPIDKKSQDQFFNDLSTLLSRPATLYVFGGTSLICLQMEGRLTDDIDVYSADDADLADALQQLAKRYNWKIDDLDVCAISEVPTSLAREPELYARFGSLTVQILDPHLTAVGKLDRASRDDIQDLRWMRDAGLLDIRQLERLLDAAKNLDDRPASMRLFTALFANE